MMKNIHGHTKIELTNVNTGEIKTVEDNNMVTNAIELMLNAPYENMPNTANPSKLWNYLSTDPNTNVKNLTQGLILFQDAIIEDPNQIIPPGGNEVIGLGYADLNYNGSILEYGSYNSTESQLFPADNPKYVKYVWDFSTSQGNGIINCACLTTKQGGKMGYGVKSVDTSIQNWDGPAYPVGSSVYGVRSVQNGILIGYTSREYSHMGRNQFLWVDLKENEQSLYCANDTSVYRIGYPARSIVMWNGYYNTLDKKSVEAGASFHNGDVTHLKIKKCPLNKSHYELSSNLSYDEKEEEINIPIPQDLIDILVDAKSKLFNQTTWPTESHGTREWYYWYEAYTSQLYVTKNKIHIAFIPFSTDYQEHVNSSTIPETPARGWNPGEKMYILTIEKETWTTSIEEIINSSNEIFSLPYDGNSETEIVKGAFYITDNNILLLNNGDKTLWVYSRKNKDFIKTTSVRNGKEILITASHKYSYFYLEEANRIILCGSIRMDYVGRNYQAILIELDNAKVAYNNQDLSFILFNSHQQINSGGGSSNNDTFYNVNSEVPVYYHSLFKNCHIDGSNSRDESEGSPQIISFNYFNPLLMTINNLPEPVEKTEEYTMKVTYELTWD